MRKSLVLGFAALTLVTGGADSPSADRMVRNTSPVALRSTLIAYACPPSERPEARYDGGLCVVGGDGSDAHFLLKTGDTESGAASLSPNGNEAAYSIATGGAYQLFNKGVFLVGAAGGGAKRIWIPPPSPQRSSRNGSFGLPSPPAWSPDGRKLAITEPTSDPWLNTRDCDLWIIPIVGRAHRITDGSGHPVHCAAPSVTWSPDGKEVAYVDNADAAGAAPIARNLVMRVAVSDGVPRMIGRAPGTIIESVFWSPTGATVGAVAVGVDVLEQPVPGYPGTQSGYVPDIIETFSANGAQEPTILVHTPPTTDRMTFLRNPVWSPDGAHIAYGQFSEHLIPRGAPGETPTPSAAPPFTNEVITANADGTSPTVVASVPGSGAGGYGPQVTSWIRTGP